MNNKSDMLFGLNDKPGIKHTVLIALQHFFAIFVLIVTPSTIICGALNVPPRITTYVISMGLLMSGVGTIIQVHRFKFIGSGLLSVQGISSNFIITLIAVGKTGGLGLIFGLCAMGGLCQIKVLTLIAMGVAIALTGQEAQRKAAMAGASITQAVQFLAEHDYIEKSGEAGYFIIDTLIRDVLRLYEKGNIET